MFCNTQRSELNSKFINKILSIATLNHRSPFDLNLTPAMGGYRHLIHKTYSRKTTLNRAFSFL